MTRPFVRALFALAGCYDALIGLAFLVAGPWIFDRAGVPQPDHWGYIQFGALLLVIFGAMFFAIARDPVRNRNLMPFGMLLKLAYCGIVCYYWVTTGCPFLFKPFVAIDALMLILFLLAYRSVRDSGGPSQANGAR